MMTDPSFRCRLTFLPMYDLALFRLKLSILLPLHFFFSKASPALPADGTFFAFEHDVELDVFVKTRVFPRILTVFHFFVHQLD